MNRLSIFVVGALASLSLGACDQTVCPDGSGNCAVNGSADGGNTTGECDNPSEDSCSGMCVDTDINPNFCGSCTNTCDTGQGCSAGACVDACPSGELLCGEDAIDGAGSRSCVNPQTSSEYCGATASCKGIEAGELCDLDSACVSGVCTPTTTVRYVGSLPGATGKWSYGTQPGVAGAVEACQSLFAAPTARVCSYSDLLVAQNQGELVNPVDSNGAIVTSWFSLDPNSNAAQLQCTDPALANLPWSYETAHLGEGAQFLTVSSAGTISQVVNEPANALTPGCMQVRNVACCLP